MRTIFYVARYLIVVFWMNTAFSMEEVPRRGSLIRRITELLSPTKKELPENSNENNTCNTNFDKHTIQLIHNALQKGDLIALQQLDTPYVDFTHIRQGAVSPFMIFSPSIDCTKHLLGKLAHYSERQQYRLLHDTYGNNPMHYLVIKYPDDRFSWKHIQHLMALYARYTDINHPNNNGFTPLDIAQNQIHKNTLSLIQYLIQLGAIPFITKKEKENSNTALIYSHEQPILPLWADVMHYLQKQAHLDYYLTNQTHDDEDGELPKELPKVCDNVLKKAIALDLYEVALTSGLLAKHPTIKKYAQEKEFIESPRILLRNQHNNLKRLLIQQEKEQHILLAALHATSYTLKQFLTILTPSYHYEYNASNNQRISREDEVMLVPFIERMFIRINKAMADYLKESEDPITIKEAQDYGLQRTLARLMQCQEQSTDKTQLTQP